jgi:hypothetical protein
MYAAPGSIYRILDQNALTFLHVNNDVDLTRLDVSIRALEGQIQQETRKLRRWKKQRQAAAESRLQAANASTPPAVKTGSQPVPRLEPATPNHDLADHEHRHKEVEQKLDRILKLLEGAARGENPPR